MSPTSPNSVILATLKGLLFLAAAFALPLISGAQSDPPVIGQQPLSLTVTQGAAAAFTVSATGTAPLHYSWGVWCPPDDPRWPDCGCTPFPPCTPDLPTFALSGVSPNGAGGYYVVVANAFGTVTSQVATLTVTNPTTVRPLITQAAYRSNEFTLSFESLIGYMYEVDFTLSLTSPGWTLLDSGLATSNRTTVVDRQATGGQRFYRVVSQGPLTAPVTALEPPQAPAAQPGGQAGCSAPGQGESLPYLFSGEFHHEYTDFSVKGRGLDFVWKRKYRSKVGPDTAIGKGWEFSYNIRVQPTTAGFDVSDGSGRTDTYRRQPDGTYTASQLFTEGTLSNTVFRVKFPDSGVWEFLPLDGSSSQGKVQRIVDRNGNALAFDYSPAGRLTNVVDALGRNIQVSYTAEGLVSAITDFAGRQVTYAYYQNGDAGGSFGDLKSVTSPAVIGTPNGNDFPAGKTVTYTYSKGFGDERLNHNLLTITDGKGQTWLQNTYAATTDPADYNFDRLLSQARGGSNEVLTFYYKPQSPIPGNLFAVSKAIVNDRMGNVSEYLFDAYNRLVRSRAFTGRAVAGVTVTETSNRPGDQLRPSDPDFFETRWEWNADSKLTRILYPNGSSVLNTYEAALTPSTPQRFRGNLRARTSLPGPLGGDQTTITETFVYDTSFGGCCGFNFVTQATDGRGNTTYHAYDSHGNRTNTIQAISSAVESFEYNAFGQMTAHVWPDNGSNNRRRDVTTYYGNGPQTGYVHQQIIDSQHFALTTTYEYDAVGNATRVVDPRGNDTFYTHNALNQTVREESRLVNLGGASVRYLRHFYYDANDNLAQTEVQNVDDLGAIGSDAWLTTTHNYDLLNRPTSLVQEVAGTHMITTESHYDGNGNLTLVRSGEATSGQQTNNEVATVFDERNLPFQEIRAPHDPAHSTTQFDYDANGNLLRTLQGLEDATAPRVTISAYDGFNRAVATTDPMGNVTTTHYDAVGNAVSTRVEGELTDVSGSAGNVRLAETAFSYDAMNRLVQTDQSLFDAAAGTNILGGHAVSRTVYSANAQVLQTIDADNHTNSVVYDSANRQSVVTDPRGNTRAYAYDANNNVTSVTEVDISDLGKPPRTVTTSAVYDGQDRQITTTDQLGYTNRAAYDSRNNRTVAVDERGNVTRYDYDGLNRLVATTHYLTSNGQGNGTPIGTIVTRRAWDNNSRVTGETDGNLNSTTYVYDALNRAVQTVFADSTTLSNSYDSHGNSVLSADANGTTVVISYDWLNRVTAKAVTPGPGVAGTTFESYQYDGLSRVVFAQNNDSLVTRRYDSLGRQLRETQQGLSSGTPTRTIGYTCDLDGNRLTYAYPGGRVVSASYDSLNRKKAISDGSGTIASYDYSGRGRVERRDYGNGARAVLTYDGLRRMTNSQQFVIAGGVIIDKRAYAWDPAGNKTAVTTLPLASVENRTLAYDSVKRLIQSDNALVGPTIAYTFDNVGNRTALANGTLSGVYTMSATAPPADFQMNQYTTTPVDTRTHDANGNLASAGQRLFAYDYRNRLVAVLSQSGQGTYTSVLSAKYDCFDRRIEKTTAAGTVRYYYSGWQEIEEQDGADATVATFVWGASLDDALSFDRGGHRYFYHADDLGSVKKVTDSTGTVVEQYTYGDYGEPVFADGSGTTLPGTAIGNATLFTGRRYDPETGLYYYRTRYLEPTTGRFITRDSIGLWGDGNNLGNGYSYVGNSPFDATDPLGMFPKCWPCNCPPPGQAGPCNQCCYEYLKLDKPEPLEEKDTGTISAPPAPIGPRDTRPRRGLGVTAGEGSGCNGSCPAGASAAAIWNPYVVFGHGGGSSGQPLSPGSTAKSNTIVSSSNNDGDGDPTGYRHYRFGDYSCICPWEPCNRPGDWICTRYPKKQSAY